MREPYPHLTNPEESSPSGVRKRRLFVKMQTRPGLAPLISFIEMALNQFLHHLDEFFESPAVRGHARVVAHRNEHSVFFMDVKTEFHISNLIKPLANVCELEFH